MSDTIRLHPTSIRAAMARSGILPHQLVPYWSPDREAVIDPLQEQDTQRAMAAFLHHLEVACLRAENGKQAGAEMATQNSDPPPSGLGSTP